MSPSDFSLSRANWTHESRHSACRALREAVFVVAQRGPIEVEYEHRRLENLRGNSPEAGSPIGVRDGDEPGASAAPDKGSTCIAANLSAN